MPKIGHTTRESINALNASDFDTWLRERLSATSIKEYGAYGDDNKDDTQAFVNALRDNSHVVVPPGTYNVTGFTIDGGKTLELLAGAVLRTTGTINVNGSGTRLVGHVNGMKYVSPFQGEIAGTNIIYAGTEANDVVVQVESGNDSPSAIYISGIFVDGAYKSGVIGWRLGPTSGGGGPFWSTFRDIGAVRTTVGMDIAGNVQTCDFFNIQLFNENDSVTAITGRTGLRIGYHQGNVITTLKFFGGRIGNYQTSIKIGNESLASNSQGAYHCSFYGVICDTPQDNVAGGVCYLDWISANQCMALGCQLNGGESGPGFTARAIKFGRNGQTYYKAVSCSIFNCDIGAPVAIEGWGWEYCCIRDNTFQIQNGTAGVGRVFKNSGSVGGSEPIRRFMEYSGNRMLGGNQGCPEIDNTSGFNKGSMFGADVDQYGNRTTPIDLSCSPYQQTINNAAEARVMPTTLGTFRGWLEVVDGGGGYARFWIPSLTGAPVELEDSAGTYTATGGNPATVNFYYDGGAGYHKLQNNTAAPIQFFFNMKAFPNGG